MTKNDQRPLFVSIGAGKNQVPMMKEARNLGFHLVGVDRDPLAPGLALCDIKIHESILNPDDILPKINELFILGDIKGVLCRSYGRSIKTVATLAEKLHQPYLPPKMVEAFNNKAEMKRFFIENGIMTPDYRVTTVDNAQKIASGMRFPLVVKPLSGHGKRNVKLVYSKKELRSMLATLKNKKARFLMEEYVEGDELIVIGIVHDGRFFTVDISDKVRSPRPYFTDRMHLLPSVYLGNLSEYNQLGQMIAGIFHIKSSPLVIELIVNKNGTPFVIEVVPEFGGEYLADIAIPARTGYNMFEQAIRSVTGMNFTRPPLPASSPVVSVKYLYAGGGRLRSFNDISPSRRRGILHAEIFKKAGDQLKEPINNHDRLGVIVTRGKSVNQTLDRAGKTLKNMNIEIE